MTRLVTRILGATVRAIVTRGRVREFERGETLNWSGNVVDPDDDPYSAWRSEDAYLDAPTRAMRTDAAWWEGRRQAERDARQAARRGDPPPRALPPMGPAAR